MKRLATSSVVIALALAHTCWADGILDFLAKEGVWVVYGRDSSAAEKDCARRIADELKKRGAKGQLLYVDDQADPFTKLEWRKNKYYDPQTGKWVEPPIASTHLITVGLPSDNTVLDRTWGHWASRPSASGFRIFGYDSYAPRDVIGYIESDRNYYSLHVEDYPFKQNIKITGGSPEGVKLAAEAFLRENILNGVITNKASGRKTWDLWHLGRAQYLAQRPEWIPAGSYEKGKTKLEYLGWNIPCSLIYSQFLQVSRVEPRRIWKVKYVTDESIHDFETGLHSRASGNELLVVELVDEAAVKKAVEHLTAWLYGSWWTKHDAFGLKLLRAQQAPNTYLHLLAHGRYLIMEDFDPPYDEMILTALGRTTSSKTDHPGPRAKTSRPSE